MSRSTVPHCPTEPRDNLPRDVASASRPRAANPHIAALTEVVETNCRRPGVLSHPCSGKTAAEGGGSLSRTAGEGRGGGSPSFTLRTMLEQVALGQREPVK